jgi:hypothetical protein
MGVCMTRPPRSRRHAKAARAVALLTLAAALAASQPITDSFAGSGGLIVIPRPASGAALSYFKLSGARGKTAQAGIVMLKNQSSRPLRVALSAVAGETLDTLGSTYAPRASGRAGPTRWLRLGERQVKLAPGGAALVPVSVLVPRNARPGDYLSGVSVEALGQKTESGERGVSIASVVRYVIGVETTVPGARRAKIQFTGARAERQPSALTFLLDARNRGNVILQNVAGKALITRGARKVASVPLGPGTFVTRSSIAYPVPTPRERPREGAVYRVRAYLRYAGGIARLDTLVRFGRADAVRQQAYGGGKSSGHGSGPAAWLIALLAAALLYGVAMTALLLRRRRHPAASPGAR